MNDEFDVKKLSDEFGEEGDRLSKRMQEINPVSLKEILNEVRRMANLKVYACTADLKLMELEEDKVKSRVDDILGLTTL